MQEQGHHHGDMSTKEPCWSLTSFHSYEKWGISGIKFGFVGWVRASGPLWLHNAVKKCADPVTLMVDIHDGPG